MPWKPLPRLAFAICTYPFTPSSTADLPLQIGDELYIIEQGGTDGAWYRGYLVAPPSLLAGLTSTRGQPLEARVFAGIFPRDCVEIREYLGDVSRYAPEEDQSIHNGQKSTNTQDEKLETDPNGLGEWPTPPRQTGEPATSTSPRAKQSGRESPPSTIPETIRKHKHSQSQLSGDGSVQTGNEREPFSGEDDYQRSGRRPPAPVPMLKVGDETATSKSEPLVDEIASCLREWHSLNLHELLLSREYGLLDDMLELVTRLDATRRQLLHKILTKQELEGLRESAIWDLVNGNKLLGGDVVVRSTAQMGRILTNEDSAVEISKLQSMMSLLGEKPVLNPEAKKSYHLLVDLKNFAIDANKSTTFALCLYIKPANGIPSPFSETYAFDASSTEQNNKSLLDGRTKTLFTDLSISESTDGAPDNATIYLVIRVYTNEQPKVAPSKIQESLSTREGQLGGNINATWRSASFKAAGRRSMVFGHKVRNESKSTLKLLNRPDTGTSILSPTPETRPTSSPNDSGQEKPVKPVKRTTGVGVLNVSEIIRSRGDAEQEVKIWSVSASSDIVAENQEEKDGLVDIVFPSMLAQRGRSSIVNRVKVHAKGFGSSDSESLIEATPTLLQNIQSTKRIGFAGAPTRPRSDIYFTLLEPALMQNALLSHPRSGTVPMGPEVGLANLQLTMEVRNGAGDRIENCIYPSSNSAGHTAWRTSAVERGESWNQTVRLAVEPDEVPGSHIIMSLADAGNFPFALCWMPLWTQDAFLRDGDHSLALYKYDEYTSSMIAGKGAYLSLPWSSRSKDETVTGPIASLKARTYLCSTKYSQDPNLLGLLRWRDQDSKDLATLLTRFTFVPEIEIVKLLNEVFDALFESLVEYSGKEDMEDLILNALITVLGILHDRRFNLQPLIDQYAENKFNFPFAFRPLMKSFHRLLQDPSNPETSRKLRAACKVGGHLFKFIVNARQQQIAKEMGIGIQSHQATFAKDFHAIFASTYDLMRSAAPILVGTKTILVQNFHTWLPPLSAGMTPDEVMEIASNFLDASSRVQGKLVLFKLVLLNNLTFSSFLSDATLQQTWIKRTQHWLDSYWGTAPAVSSQWREQIRLCSSIIATQVVKFGLSTSEWAIGKLVESYKAIKRLPRSHNGNFSLLFPTTYPFPTKPTAVSAHYDEALIETSALLAALTDAPPVSYMQWPLDTLADLLMDTMGVSISILNREAFPASWLSLFVYHHNSTLKGLEAISTLLIARYLPDPDDADEFNIELWRTFFLTLLKLVGSEALALETFAEQRRRAVWKIGGDVRRFGADLLLRMWEAIGWDTSTDDKKRYGLTKMGGYQVQYVPGLVGPILDLCLSVHDGLRSTAILILQTMIVSEWGLNQDLAVIQAEMIDRLDHLFQERQVNEALIQKAFISELIYLFEPLADDDKEDPLFLAVKDLFEKMDQLLDLLVAVHSPVTSGEGFQIMDTLRLMDFLKAMNKEKIFIGYVHRLAQVQVDSGNPTGAGLALKMHADLYEWDSTVSQPSSKDPRFPGQTSFERREQIYFQMIKNFEEGQAWHSALNAYQELAAQYEHNVFDFAKLARTQRAMATVHDKISKGDHKPPRYFRVHFRGLGFAPAFRDRQFIFEGSPTDRLSSFTDKMQQQYPSAQIIGSGSIDDIEGQYLSIYPVSPQKDLLHPVNRRAKILPTIKEHFLLAQPHQFTTTSRRQASNAGVKGQVLEKIVFTTEEAFPTILRRSEVVNVETVHLTPIQIGLERTIRKTQELRTLETSVAEGGDTPFTSLTEQLMILVNPDSTGNVAEYWSLLPKSAVVQDDADEGEPVEQVAKHLDPLEEALKAALIDHVYTIRRCLDQYNRSAHQATKAELVKDLEKTFGPVIAAMPTPWDAPSGDRGFSPALSNQSPRAEMSPLGFTTFRPDELDAPTKSNASPPVTSNPGTSSGQTHNFDTKKSNEHSGRTEAHVQKPSTATSALSKLDPQRATAPQPNGSDQDAPSKQGLQSRMGSVTKRFSALNIGKKTSKGSVKNQTMQSVDEG